jgi:hypothetical protein
VGTEQDQLVEKFTDTFGPHLDAGNRWLPFSWMAGQLLAKGTPLRIIETGCVRAADNWLGDGQSTRLWDWLVRETGGSGYSIDLSEDSTAVARSLCPNMQVVCSDSVLWLAQNKELLKTADLLYLDSYDFYEPYTDSMIHHVAEFATAANHLPKGCFIAVDDCHTPTWGKQGLVKGVLAMLGVSPVVEGYVTIWQKP